MKYSCVKFYQSSIKKKIILAMPWKIYFVSQRSRTQVLDNLEIKMISNGNIF